MSQSWTWFPRRATPPYSSGTTHARPWAPYEDEVLENGLLQLYYGSFFVRSQGKTILVDTGMGPGPHAHLENRTGDLIGQMQAKGVGPDDVDIVIHTHLHPDHVGWNVDSSGDADKPYFPKAQYLGPRKDWEHFMQPEVLPTAPHISQNVIPLNDLGLIEFIDDGTRRHRRDNHTGDARSHSRSTRSYSLALRAKRPPSSAT